jgi:type II restriction/modification system DNA methylase subunit YeeA
MNVSQFVAKWRMVELTERSASQQHFLDLCRVFDHPTPAEADPTGASFTFEKGATKHGGGQGWADVWKRGFFGWEYKGKHKDLNAAYDQLLLYREALENPPLLIVCDMDRFVVHTNFTATAKKTYEITLDDLNTPRSIEILRYVFHDPDKLRPSATSDAITREVAERLASVAEALRNREFNPTDVARFLDRIVFCLFAEDVGLLPKKLFSEIAENAQTPKQFADLIGQLFAAMADGGYIFVHSIKHFNGNLFVDSPVLELTSAEIKHVQAAARLDWSAVDPSIFGTLFQRGLDPDTRAQLGAQYTNREDIETLIEPVVMRPLRREWESTRDAIENLLKTGKANPTGKEKPLTRETANKAHREARSKLRSFHERLANVKILDPACGSGNFLYVTLQKLKDLEKEVLVFAGDLRLGSFFGLVNPLQFYGIEINPYAFELAQTTLWIGYLQWIQANGFGVPAEPILREMDNFRNMDAILDLADPNDAKQPEWPEADFIVGNPPFLGGKRLRTELGNEYVEKLFAVYRSSVPPEADLVTYWFEKARSQIQKGMCKRAGLLATQGIRGGANRKVLEKIKETGDIFFAESDRNWILDGATVHVSMIGFDDGSELEKTLNGHAEVQITPELSADFSVYGASGLSENRGVSFMGITPAGTFDVEFSRGLDWLNIPNATGQPNSDVIRPYFNGMDLNQRARNQWTVDFGTDLSIEQASRYEAPFEYVLKTVRPQRSTNRREAYKDRWWIYAEARPAMRMALMKRQRFLATSMVSKHRLFSWLPSVILPANVVIVFGRDDDYFLGVLQSRIHRVWSSAQGTQLREKESGARYTPTTCFETFPFPECATDEKLEITRLAAELDALRSRWLNPPEWTRKDILTFPGSVDGPWAQYVCDVDERGIGTVRYPRLISKDDAAALQLAKRTLTNLYNEQPTWLDLAHQRLDEAVFAAYGWEPTLSNEDILTRLLALNQERAAAE